MATKRNTPRQNYGNPFSAGSSVAQGAALAAPGFVDYSQFFDTSATPGLQAAQQGLFTQIALANEQHAKNMENILPANFDETQVAPGAVDGMYEMLNGLKDQAFNLSRTASNFRGTKKGDMAQMELNKIKSQMAKNYGNNVEYNSMMLDHNKNKDFYSTSYNFMPGKAEEYQKYVKFVDPSAKISYDGKTMMIESEDGDKISFEDLKKLEPAMKQTELNLGVETLGVDVISKSLNGKMVTDGEIDLKLNALITKANMDNGNIQDGILSLATDLTFKHDNTDFNFYNYLNSNPELKSKYLTEDGKFKTFEDPTQRDTYYKELEKDVKNYFRSSIATARDTNIAAFEKEKTDAEQAVFDRETKRRSDEIRLRYSFTGNGQGTDRADLLPLLKQIDEGVETNINSLNNIPIGTNTRLQISPTDVEGQYNIAVVGIDPRVAGTYGKRVISDVVDINDKGALKNTLFNLVSGNENTWRSYVGDKWNPNMYTTTTEDGENPPTTPAAVTTFSTDMRAKEDKKVDDAELEANNAIKKVEAFDAALTSNLNEGKTGYDGLTDAFRIYNFQYAQLQGKEKELFDVALEKHANNPDYQQEIARLKQILVNSLGGSPADKTQNISEMQFLPEIIKQSINAKNTPITALDNKTTTGTGGIVNKEFDKILGYIVHLSQNK